MLLLSVWSWGSGRCDADGCLIRAGSLLPFLTLFWDWAVGPGGVPGGGGTTAIADFWLEEKLLSQEIRHLNRDGTFRQSCKIIGACFSQGTILNFGSGWDEVKESGLLCVCTGSMALSAEAVARLPTLPSWWGPWGEKKQKKWAYKTSTQLQQTFSHRNLCT